MSYEESVRRRLDAISEGLGSDVSVLPERGEDVARRAMAELLELACRCQAVANLELGRSWLRALPKRWPLQRIERDVAANLDLSDGWEFVRVGELYEILDRELALRHVERGLEAGSAEVGAAARDLLDRLREREA